jgi:hypothetical protein
MMRNFIYSFILLLVLCACNGENAEENIIIPNSQINNTNSETTVINSLDGDFQLDAENTNNSLDFIGYNHNACLDYASTKVDVDTASDQDFFDEIKDYFYNLPISQDFIDALDNQTTPVVFLDGDDINNGISFDDYIQNYTYSNTELRDSIFSDLQDIVLGNTTATSEQDIIDDIIDYEDNFIATYPDSIELRFLGGFSILRYSIKYWTEANMNNSHPYHDLVTDKLLEENRLINPLLMLYLLADCFSYNDCLENGGAGAQNQDDAIENCQTAAAYGSATVFRGFRGP